MNEISSMAWPFIGGLFLGTLFFGGLWLTVKKISTSKISALLVVVSFFFRVSIVLIGFYFIGLGDWRKLVVCLAGFIISRFIVIYYTRLLDQKKLQLTKEDNHET